MGRNTGWPDPKQAIFLVIFFKFILQKYTTVSKFISFGHQPPWRGGTAVGVQQPRR
jgi:hypothetical protein